MRLATIEDKGIVLNILAFALKDNPTLTSISRKSNGENQILPILEYAFYYSLVRKGVYISDNNKCIAFLNHKKNKGSFLDFIHSIKLIIKGINISKIISIYKHFKTIESLKPTHSNYFHFWFLGADSSSDLKSSTEFIHELIEFSKKHNSSIYAETTLPKNELVFTRFGFSTYNIVESKNLNLKVYLMKLDYLKD